MRFEVPLVLIDDVTRLNWFYQTFVATPNSFGFCHRASIFRVHCIKRVHKYMSCLYGWGHLYSYITVWSLLMESIGSLFWLFLPLRFARKFSNFRRGLLGGVKRPLVRLKNLPVNIKGPIRGVAPGVWGLFFPRGENLKGGIWEIFPLLGVNPFKPLGKIPSLKGPFLAFSGGIFSRLRGCALFHAVCFTRFFGRGVKGPVVFGPSAFFCVGRPTPGGSW